jgi:filamentous hemagglutinin
VNTDGVRRSGLVVRNVTIYDLNGKVAYKGDMDLKPTLDRIEAGRRDPHPNDGTNYTNRERRLPYKTDSQYYTEYVVRTPGLKDVGPQRLVIGKGSEIYYTADHYVTFITITR